MTIVHTKDINNMNILHISMADFDGAGSCCYKIHKSLLELGVNSKILVLRKKTNDENVIVYKSKKLILWKIFNKLLRILHLTLTDYNRIKRLELMAKVSCSLPVSVIDITNHEMIKKADIIHLHWVNNFIDYPSFFAKVNKPIVWTLHDENLFLGVGHYEKYVDKDDPLEKKYYNVKFRSINKIKNLYVVFLSKMMFQKFGHNEIIAKAHKTIINNSVDYRQFSIFNKLKAREYFNLDKKNIYIVFVAVNILDERKGLNLLIKAVRNLNENIKILAVGNYPADFKDDTVVCLGPINDTHIMSLAYSCGDYFAMPSSQEAFAQTPLEAMSCGLPVIAFPASGTEELIKEYNGVRCKGFSENDLLQGINKAIRTTYDPQVIRQDMINRFSPQKIGLEYMRVYEELKREGF